jgi:hypothetical protein
MLSFVIHHHSKVTLYCLGTICLQSILPSCKDHSLQFYKFFNDFETFLKMFLASHSGMKTCHLCGNIKLVSLVFDRYVICFIIGIIFLHAIIIQQVRQIPHENGQ